MKSIPDALYGNAHKKKRYDRSDTRFSGETAYRHDCNIPRERLTQGEYMSDVIEFLEKMGQDATLRHASPEDMELAMRDAQIDEPLSSAMLAGNASELQTLLNLRPMFAIQGDPTPGEEEEQPGKEEDPDQGDDTPPQEGRWTSSRSATVSA